jgi:hypothetical protein
MLVLNTHIDSTIALDRYCAVTGDGQYKSLVDSANRATRTVLDLLPAAWLYGPLFWLIGLTFLPTDEASRLPLWKRALKRLAWRHVVPLLPRLKAWFPRLVMPGGYIDRELCLRSFAHDYQSVNLTDLARSAYRFGDERMREVMMQGARFCRESGILRRWKEQKYQCYALGFWAEALFHICLHAPASEHRAWLADAIVDLEDLGLGVPPSMLGTNAEASAAAERVPCPIPAAIRLRVVNLSLNSTMRLLVVNPSTHDLELSWEREPVAPLNWFDAVERPVTAPLSVPARGWLWGTGDAG